MQDSGRDSEQKYCSLPTFPIAFRAVQQQQSEINIAFDEKHGT